MAGDERHEFQAEVRQLLDLMVHSLYSHKDIFLRELISNASDALDKRRFEAVTRPELGAEAEPRIVLAADGAARTLSVDDNGIGMSRAEVVAHLGTIARSGTREFLSGLREQRARAAPGGSATAADGSAAGTPELVGQFGVGFYSAFMVADRITVLTRRAGEAGATRWESTGDGAFTVAEAERPTAGTTVTLHLKPVDEEDGRADYTAEPVLRGIVKRYSDFVAHPITLGGATLNSMKAIWTRPPAEVSDEEYREFYKHIAHDWSDPLERIAVHMEGTVEARALLFVPAQPPLDLFQRDAPRRGLQLYAKRVFIMDDCRELLPDWLRFIRGVVASDDVSLNVSRELLQQDRQIQAIRRHLTRRVLGALGEMKAQRTEPYREFWSHFGAVLKEGLFSAESSDRDRLLELVLAGSTHAPGAMASLGEYVERARPGHDAIYYITGPSRAVAEASPHLEALRARGEEVLIFTDPVDEVWLGRPLTFGSRRFVSVTQGELPAAEGDHAAEDQQREEQTAALGGLLDALRAVLQDRVSAVRVSARLTSSPACLVSDAGEVSPQLRELLRRAGQEMPAPKRALEINGGHPLVERLRATAERDRKAPELETAAELLYGLAVLAEGGALDDPAAFGRRLADVMERAL